jgi:hypothetical protein
LNLSSHQYTPAISALSAVSVYPFHFIRPNRATTLRTLGRQPAVRHHFLAGPFGHSHPTPKLPFQRFRLRLHPLLAKAFRDPSQQAAQLAARLLPLHHLQCLPRLTQGHPLVAGLRITLGRPRVQPYCPARHVVRFGRMTQVRKNLGRFRHLPCPIKPVRFPQPAQPPATPSELAAPSHSK